MCGHADHEIACAGLQRMADKAASLRPPGEAHLLAEIVGDHVGKLVFEAGFGKVREREVVWIGANTQRA
jgi:hypothetical protein